MVTRRSMLLGLTASLIAAPAVIRTPGLLMTIVAPHLITPEEYARMLAFDKLIRPPMVMDAALRSDPLTMLPGSITYIDSRSYEPAWIWYGR